MSKPAEKRMSRLDNGAMLTRTAEVVRVDGESRLGLVYANFSTRLPDSYGTVFLPSAYPQDLPEYQRNPVMYHAHDMYMLPVARAVNLAVDDQRLFGAAEFDMEDPEAARIAGKYDRGFMRGFSVRIRVLAAVGDWSGEDEIATLPEPEQTMLRKGRIWAVVTRARLVEISTCGSPSNPGSLSSRDAGGPDVLAELAERIGTLEEELRSERAAREAFEIAHTLRTIKI